MKIRIKMIIALVTSGSFFSKAQTISITQIQQACNNNGILEVTATGFVPPVTFFWATLGGSITHVSSNAVDTLFNYSGESIYCFAQDNSANAASATFWGPPFYLHDTVVNPVCPVTMGSGTVTITGGAAPYQINWYDAYSGILMANGSPASLPTGVTYSVMVTDANGCVASINDSANNVTQLSSITLTVATTTANCTNGTANVTSVSGAVSPYTFLWSNGSSSQQITNLTQGSYYLSVTDAQGCVGSAYANVPQSITIGANVVPTAATCLQNDGTAITFGSGGVPPYSYAYSNGQNTQTATGFVSGWYQVDVTDANGCTSGTNWFYINASTPITVNYTATPSSCTAPTGSATLAVTGGQTPYTINWSSSPPQTGTTLSNVPDGSYYFNVTDANGCVRSGSVYVPNISSMSASVNTVPANCPSNNGAAGINAYTNNPPLTYSWTTGATTSSINNLAPGVYTCVMVDAAGCQLTKNALITTVSPINIGFITNQASCKFTSDGSITASPTGGTPPYSYSWNTGGSGATISGLKGNFSYWVSVTDANCCSQQQWVYLPYNALNDSCYCTVTGTVYDDANGNCVMDAGETPIHNIMINNNNTITSYNIPSYMFTAVNGTYSFQLPTGSYNMQEVVQYFYPLSSCQSNNNPLNITASSGCTYTIDFANSINPIHDVHIITSHYNYPIPGNQYNQQVIIQNDGAVTENNITSGYKHDGQLQLVSISGPAFTQPNSSLAPDWYSASGITLAAATGIAANIAYNTPTNIPLGTTVDFKDTAAYAPPMSNSLNDYSPWNNVNAYSDVVVGSFDPNIKEVTPKGVGPQGYITSGDTVLDYVIHFQNTGTWPASKIVVVDTLDSDLEWQTLKPGYSEHTYTTTMDNNGVVSFTFNNINLPPASSSALGSIGTIAYSIHTKKGLAQGTQFTNSAAIFFDYNSPVITNTTLNTLNDAIGIAEVKSHDGRMRIYPNPANESCTVKVSAEREVQAQLMVYTINGEVAYATDIMLQPGENVLPLRVASFASGLYVVRLTYGDQMHYCKLSVTR